jgi:MYXO-CTERM domain-containing protein
MNRRGAVRNLFQRVAQSSPYRWYLAALFPIGIGWFMYGLEASEWKRLRLYDPVPATGAFARAECITYRRGRDRNQMVISYTFSASVYANDPNNLMAQTQSSFTAKQGIVYPSREACEVALPAVQSARAPHAVWYERSQPHMSKTTLEEPDSTRFLWICLGAIPLAAIGGLLQWRRRRS